MYRAQYSFQSQDSDTSALDFKENDTFTVLDTKNPHWWLVQDGKGHIGYVPGNYLSKIEGHGLNEVLQSIDRAVAVIKQQGVNNGKGLTALQASNIQKLQRHRENVIAESRQITERLSFTEDEGQQSSRPSRAAPAPPSAHDSGGSHGNRPPSVTRQAESRSKKSQAPPPPARDSDNEQSPRLSSPPHMNNNIQPTSPSKTNVSKKEKTLHSTSRSSVSPLRNAAPKSPTTKKFSENPAESSSKIPEKLCMDLIASIRSRTNLSYDMSRVAVATVLTDLRNQVPCLRGTMDTILQTMQTSQNSLPDDESEDARRLREHFRELTACKDDSQQRSWFLHEDESTICAHLSGLFDILENANADLCRRIVSENNYEGVHNLALYYQMETRVTIRVLLLQVFGALCSLEVSVISELLNSVLPLELARDMQATTEDLQKLKYSAYVLTMLFSTGESLPFHHYEHLNQSFVQFLLDQVEEPPEDDPEDQIPDLAIQVLLAYNLHFELPSENFVMQVLAQQSTANNFMQKVMLLVNREDDPVRILTHEPAPPNSVLKFLGDLYSSPATANLLYTNDAKVLIDIVLRQITNRCPGDKLRTEYLSLVHLILKTSSYTDHEHRRRELQDSLLRISQENEDDVGVDTTMDRLIVQQIGKDLSQCFDRL